MSECVVRMEMPENCECCPMVFTADVPGYHWCAALEQEVEQGLSRPKECPIICSLPKGHGRLVDADALLDYIVHNYCDDCDDCNGLRCRACPHDDDVQCIEDAPTIVPAAERSET